MLSKSNKTFLIIIITSALIFLKFYFSTLTINFSPAYYIPIFLRTNKIDLIPKCSPYKQNYEPYSVIIDGITYPRTTPLFLNQSFDFDCLNSGGLKATKRIMLWTTYEGNYEWDGFGNGLREPFIRNNCPVVNCDLATNRSLLNESDYVVVNWVDFPFEKPSFRSPDQRWIVTHYESPTYGGPSSDPRLYDSVFNMTSTYKRNSDFPDFYAHTFYWELNETFDENTDFWAKKTNNEKFAAATISNCGANFQRLKYIDKMKKSNISVDVFGRCTGVQCVNGYRKTNDACKEMIGTEYKFYLTFENSVCKDYITEKFFDILKYNIIPVVHGAGPYDVYVLLVIYSDATCSHKNFCKFILHKFKL
jgi:hypothetical protein